MNTSVSAVKEALRTQHWPVYCIRGRCGRRSIMSGSIQSSDNVELTCPICGFQVTVPTDWYHMSSSRTLGFLLRNIQGIDEADARVWINNTKYTHPTYWLSQKFERNVAQKRFQEILGIIVDRTTVDSTNLRVAAIGANNCIELESLPFEWKEENILAVDIAEGALRTARKKYSGIQYCVEFAENLSKKSVNLDQEPLGTAIEEAFDICLALRIFQSSRFQIWSALVRIRDILKPGGWIVISVPRKTALISGNIHPGIFRSDGHFDEAGPKQEAELIAHELTSGTGMFNQVTLYYGSPEDVEYYIIAQRSD